MRGVDDRKANFSTFVKGFIYYIGQAYLSFDSNSTYSEGIKGYPVIIFALKKKIIINYFKNSIYL